MASRIINSPGVQINEINDTAIQNVSVGTDVFVTGFANKGPTDEIITISSLSEFEQIFGTPTNAAERYLYYSVRPLVGTGANIMVSRLPYGAGSGEGFGSQYSAVVYPVVAVSGNQTTGGKLLSALDATGVDAYVFGKPAHFTLSKAQYLSCISGQAFNWSNTTTTGLVADPINTFADFGKAGLIIFNKAQTTINDRYEGYYIGVIDNSNANPATSYDGILTANTVNTAITTPGSIDTLTQVPLARLNFNLSGASNSNGSLSQALENAASFNIGTNSFNDYITLGVVKLRQSIFSPDTIKLDYILEEKYVASLDYHRQRTPENGGPITSAYLGTESEGSRNVVVMVNDYISNRNSSTWLDNNGIPSKSVRFLTNELETLITTSYNQVSGTIGINSVALSAAKNALTTNYGYADTLIAAGAYVDPTATTKEIGSIPSKLDRVLSLVENDELYDIDVSVEAGLGTIYAATCAAQVSYYDDTLVNNNLLTALGNLQTTLNYTAPVDDRLDMRGNYNTIFQRFAIFAADRMDHIFIADPIRHILVTSNNVKTLSDSTKSWSQHVFSPLRHQFELANTSYAAAYANWARVNDRFSQTNVWIPFSGIVAGDFAKSDRDYAYWSAPAGYKRGLIEGVDDVAITPNQKQRDDLYKFNLNPIAQTVRDGIVIMGQKTLNRTPNAFDRVNVRRLFIILEKETKNKAKYYVFEPNTLYTRTRLTDDLRPSFEAAKAAVANQGIYDYIIICDDRNNPASVIDANELVADIYIKPTRTAEFILVNFHATRTSVNFAEILR